MKKMMFLSFLFMGASLSGHVPLFRNPMTVRSILINRPCIIKSILQDYPEAIKVLQDKGIFEGSF